MKNDHLKSELFSTFSQELSAEGATQENTQVIEVDEMPNLTEFCGSFVKIMKKVGQRFVTLVGKWGGLSFLLYVSMVQAVPKHTPIFLPTDDKPVAMDVTHDYQSFDLQNLPLSGSAQLWLAEFGPAHNSSPTSLDLQYSLYPGDKILLVPGNWTVPDSYFPTLTGNFIDPIE